MEEYNDQHTKEEQAKRKGDTYFFPTMQSQTKEQPSNFNYETQSFLTALKDDQFVNDIKKVTQKDPAIAKISQLHEKLYGTVVDLDEKIKSWLVIQEQKYLKIYENFINEKEQQLRDLMNKLREKHEKDTLKDVAIKRLKEQVFFMQSEAAKSNAVSKGLKEKMEEYKSKYQQVVDTNKMLKDLLFEMKRENKTLKLSILKMKKDGTSETPEANPDMERLEFLLGEKSLLSNQTTSRNKAAAMLFKNSPSFSPNRSATTALETRRDTKRNHSPYSNTFQPENTKFSWFLDHIFETVSSDDARKREILLFVSRMEGSYTRNIENVKLKSERLKKQMASIKSEAHEGQMDRNELENMFIECLEETKKEIVKRRIKSDLKVKKDLVNVIDWEATLEKISDMSKERVKYEDFSQIDKWMLIERFITSDDIMRQLYNIVFKMNERNRSPLNKSSFMPSPSPKPADINKTLDNPVIFKELAESSVIKENLIVKKEKPILPNLELSQSNTRAKSRNNDRTSPFPMRLRQPKTYVSKHDTSLTHDRTNLSNATMVMRPQTLRLQGRKVGSITMDSNSSQL